jgi:ankyrin repeat protein
MCELLSATKKGDLDKIKQIINSECGEDLNKADSDVVEKYHRAMSISCYNDNLSIFKYFVGLGLDFEHCDNDYLFTMIYRGNIKGVRYLVDLGSDPTIFKIPEPMFKSEWNRPIFNPHNPLENAIVHGHMEIMRYLISLGCELKHKGAHILKNIVSHGCLEMVKYLVQLGCMQEFDNLKFNKHDLLNSAAFCRQADMIKYLIETKIVDPEPDAIKKALISASCWTNLGTIEVVKYLIENYIVSEGIESQQDTIKKALTAAAGRANLETINYLMTFTVVRLSKLQLRTVITEYDAKSYHRLLKESAQYGNSKVFKYFFELEGISQEKRNANKLFKTAAKSGKLNIVRYLVRSGNSIDNIYYAKSIKSAALNKHLFTVKYLINLDYFDIDSMVICAEIKAKYFFCARYLVRANDNIFSVEDRVKSCRKFRKILSYLATIIRPRDLYKMFTLDDFIYQMVSPVVYKRLILTDNHKKHGLLKYALKPNSLAIQLMYF